MIVVTGGAGFIGSNVVKALCDAGEDVAVVDYLGSDDKWKNLRDCAIWNFWQPEDITCALTSGATAVIHLGAISSTTATNADEVMKTNFTLSCYIWEWCAHHNVPLIYASSAATYGNGSQGFDDRAELSTLRPLNLYGWSKHLFDQKVAACVAKGRARPPQWAGLKFFNVYGPRETHKGSMASVCHTQYHALKQGAGVRLFRSTKPGLGDGEQSRDFVWVGDCVNVIQWLLANSNTSGLFNVGTGVARSFNNVAHALFESMGLPRDISYIDMPQELREKYQNHTQACMQKLRSAGYSAPMCSIEDGIRQYVEWFEENST
tara:strand:- start:4377 stop:5333 length:957 start_codon:yes stop_codon:yes gene_type:complete